MSKKEFLDILYRQLSDQLSSDLASAHTQYYQDYIDEELRSGKSLQEILTALGDPRLIAKTLIDTGAQPSSFCRNTGQDSGTDDFSETGSQEPRRHTHRLDLSTWYGKLIVILTAAAVLVLLFMALSFLIPVLLVVSAVLFLISWFRKKH